MGFRTVVVCLVVLLIITACLGKPLKNKKWAKAKAKNMPADGQTSPSEIDLQVKSKEGAAKEEEEKTDDSKERMFSKEQHKHAEYKQTKSKEIMSEVPIKTKDLPRPAPNPPKSKEIMSKTKDFPKPQTMTIKPMISPVKYDMPVPKAAPYPSSPSFLSNPQIPAKTKPSLLDGISSVRTMFPQIPEIPDNVKPILDKVPNALGSFFQNILSSGSQPPPPPPQPEIQPVSQPVPVSPQPIFVNDSAMLVPYEPVIESGVANPNVPVLDSDKSEEENDSEEQINGSMPPEIQYRPMIRPMPRPFPRPMPGPFAPPFGPQIQPEVFPRPMPVGPRPIPNIPYPAIGPVPQPVPQPLPTGPVVQPPDIEQPFPQPIPSNPQPIPGYPPEPLVPVMPELLPVDQMPQVPEEDMLPKADPMNAVKVSVGPEGGIIFIEVQKQDGDHNTAISEENTAVDGSGTVDEEGSGEPEDLLAPVSEPVPIPEIAVDPVVEVEPQIAISAPSEVATEENFHDAFTADGNPSPYFPISELIAQEAREMMKGLNPAEEELIPVDEKA